MAQEDPSPFALLQPRSEAANDELPAIVRHNARVVGSAPASTRLLAFAAASAAACLSVLAAQGPTTQLRSPLPSLQVLLGWVGAQRDGALLKYADFLAEQGYASVRSVQPTGEHLWVRTAALPCKTPVWIVLSLFALPRYCSSIKTPHLF